MEIKLDDIDRAILDLLGTNGKMGNKELANEIGLTITPTYERVSRLERDGIIKGYRAIIDQKRIGKEFHCHCHIISYSVYPPPLSAGGLEMLGHLTKVEGLGATLVPLFSCPYFRTHNTSVI